MADHVPDCNPGCVGDSHVLLPDPPQTEEQVRARAASRAAHAAMVAQNEADIAAAIGEHVDTEVAKVVRNAEGRPAFVRDDGPWPGDPI